MLLVTSSAWLLGRPREVTLNICNVAPYRISTAVNYRQNRREWRTEGYWEMAAGECRGVEIGFLRVTPKVYLFAAKQEELAAWLDNEAVAWDFERRESLAWLHGGAIPQSPAAEWLGKKLEGEEIPWETADPRCVGRALGYRNGAALYNTSDECMRREGAGHTAHFIEVPSSFEDGDAYDVWFLRGGRNVTMEVCNFTPYETALALHYQSKRAEWVTESYAKMQPGECRPFERNFQDVEPRFYAHAFADGEVARWHLGKYAGEHEMRSGGEDVALCLADGADHNGVEVRHDPDASAECAAGQTLRGFGDVGALFDGGDHQMSPITIPLVPLPETADGEINRSSAQEIARDLGRLLPQRKKHWEEFPSGTPLKYTLGISIDERVSDGAEANVERAVFNHVPGVTVTSAVSHTPFGVPIPFQVGDQIIEFDGRRIYSPEDLRMALISFAESPSRGVMARYTYKLWRGKTPLKGEGAFYFNEAGWGRSEADRREAESWGVSSGMTIGHAVKWTCRKDPGKYCEWIETQRLVRLKQMYPADYRWGALKGAAGSALFGGIAIRVLRLG
jgi:uncharacterized membrane protein